MKVTKLTIGVERVIQLRKFETLRLSVFEEIEGPPKDPADRDKLVTRLSKRLLNIEQMERRRHRQYLPEEEN